MNQCQSHRFYGLVWNMHNNSNSTDISRFSTHWGWRPLCKYQSDAVNGSD